MFLNRLKNIHNFIPKIVVYLDLAFMVRLPGCAGMLVQSTKNSCADTYMGIDT